MSSNVRTGPSKVLSVAPFQPGHRNLTPFQWKVDSILAGLLDYEQIARGSLGADWERLTDEQRKAFSRALSGLTNHAFVLAITRADVQLRFGSETVLGPKASVMVTAMVPDEIRGRPPTDRLQVHPDTGPLVDLRRSRRWSRPHRQLSRSIRSTAQERWASWAHRAYARKLEMTGRY